MLLKKYFAEFIGTFALVFAGVSAIALKGSLLTVAFAHGLILMVFVYAFGTLSGAHFNPAVSFGLLVVRKLSIKEFLFYVTSQFLGAAVASLLLVFLHGVDLIGGGATLLAMGVSPLNGLIMEAVLTFFLVSVIFFTAVKGKDSSITGISIGMVLVACILAGGPMTGASLNPARTLGPALMTGQFADIWVYFAGPLIGGALATLVSTFLISDDIRSSQELSDEFQSQLNISDNNVSQAFAKEFQNKLQRSKSTSHFK